MTEDLGAFFSASEFAETATLAGQPVTGILRAGFEDVTFDGFGPAGSSPQFLLPVASVPAKPAGASLVITSGVAQGTYKVTSHEPDGTGLVTLHLTKAKPQ
jgi:hypothetical protein